MPAEPVSQPIILARKGGVSLHLLGLGARITQLWARDRQGQAADIVLGHDRPEDYLTVGGYLGAICGRYANRIADGRFTLDGHAYALDRNEGAQQLHGGSQGFDRKEWAVTSQSEDHVTFACVSEDGDMGYPGRVQARCTYRLLEDHVVLIEMEAETSAPTVVNLANHSYFNLAGQGSGDVMCQQLRILAAHYTPVDGRKIPTGEIRPVAGSAFDFSILRPIGQELPNAGGFDHNFCLSAPLQPVAGGLMRPGAELRDIVSGRSLQLWTSAVGLQVYGGAHFDGSQPGKDGARYGKFAGIALETQSFPDSPNQPHFPSTRLDPGQLYRHLVLLDLTPV